MRSEPLETLET